METSHKLLKLYPQDKTARLNPVAALAADAAPESFKELQKMAAADPDDASTQAALAQHFAQKNDFREALQHLDRALRLMPDNLSYRLDLAILYDHAGYGAQALMLYRQVVHMQADAETQQPLPLLENAINQRIAYLAKVNTVEP